MIRANILGFLMGAIMSIALLSFVSVFQLERHSIPVSLPGHISRYTAKIRHAENGKTAFRGSVDVHDATTNERTSGVEDQNRLYCMVPITYTPKKMRHMQAIARTWGKRCDVIKFFVEPSPAGQDAIPPTFVDNMTGFEIPFVVVPMVRVNDQVGKDGTYLTKSCWGGGHTRLVPCRHIWEKVWRSWVYVAENDLHLAEWFLKVDDDTYPFPHFIKRYVVRRQWSHRDPHYFGHVLYSGTNLPTGFVSGVMVGLSQRTLELVLPVYRSMEHEYGSRAKFPRGRCVDRDGATQELTESRCLAQIGIAAEHTRDENGMESILLNPVGFSLLLRKKPGTGYFLWVKRQGTSLCCASEPLAFHNFKSSRAILKLDPLLYDANNTELIEQYSDYNRSRMVWEDPSQKADRPHLYGPHRESVIEEMFGEYYLLQIRALLQRYGFMDQP